jgi:hypothetical protein
MSHARRRSFPKRDFHPEARARFREIQRTFSRRGLKDPHRRHFAGANQKLKDARAIKNHSEKQRIWHSAASRKSTIALLI